MRWIALVSIVTVSTLAAAAQAPGDEDRRLLCPVISQQLAKSIAVQIKGAGRCHAFCRGCGCKGGPGYRGPNGCVGYADLIRVCGPPPHARCRPECVPIVAACIGHTVGRAWLRTFAAELGLEITFVPSDGGEPKP